MDKLSYLEDLDYDIRLLGDSYPYSIPIIRLWRRDVRFFFDRRSGTITDMGKWPPCKMDGFWGTVLYTLW